jgi:hypothetical protein
MADLNWAQILPSVLAGGLAGAALTQIVTIWRNRLQPIAYSIDPQVSFIRNPQHSTVSAYITIVTPHQEDPVVLNNLAIVDLKIANRGNKDFKSFKFGLTLDDTNAAIIAEYSGKYRHHSIRCLEEPTPQFPLKTLNFELGTFNRKDVYNIKLFVELPSGVEKPGDIEVGTDELGVRMVETPSFADILSIAIDTSYRIGPVLFKFR